MSTIPPPPKPPIPKGPPPSALKQEVKELEHQKEELALEIEQELAALAEIRRAKKALNITDPSLLGGTNSVPPEKQVRASRQVPKCCTHSHTRLQLSPTGKPHPPTTEPQSHQLNSLFEPSHSQYRDHSKLNSMAKAYILSDEEKLKMKAARTKKEQSLEQRKKNKISSDFEKNLLSAHMAQKKTSSNVSLISFMCKATESEVLKDFTNAVSWYKAALAFLKASDPNEIETAPIFRAHLGIGQNLKMLHRLDDAEKHFDMAVKLAKKAGDKKGLEEAAQKLGKTLIEVSREDAFNCVVERRRYFP